MAAEEYLGRFDDERELFDAAEDGLPYNGGVPELFGVELFLDEFGDDDACDYDELWEDDD